MKNLLLTILLSVTTQAATLNLVSSNQFKLGTNNVYTTSLANLTTLSNFVIGNYVSSNALVTTNWSLLTATNASLITELSSSNVTVTNILSVQANLNSSNVVVTNLLNVSGGFSLGGGATITKILTAAETLDFPATGTNVVSTLDVTVSGAGTNGWASVMIVSPNTNFVYDASITATNTVTVRAANISINDAVNPDPTSARILVFQY